MAKAAPKAQGRKPGQSAGKGMKAKTPAKPPIVANGYAKPKSQKDFAILAGK